MLDPDALEEAGELTAEVYRQIEAEMLGVIERAMIEGDVSGQRSQTALLLLVQSSAPELHAIIERHADEIDEAVRADVERALRESDADDLARIKEGLGVDLEPITTRQVAETVAGAARMIARDNIAMEEGARKAFLDRSIEAVTYVNAGVKTHDRALHEAVRALARDGIDTISYRDPSTGRTTVRNQADVAVRRHIRTQLAQDGERRTEQLMDDAGVEFVEVSSHTGARPSHQDWQGRVYSRNGRVTVDGVTYEDFGEATGYYGTGPHAALGDRLGGVNCRHSHGPWFPGMERHYDPDPKHPSGLSNDEVYRLTQGQRARERGIRATKRELAAAQRLYDADPSLENRTELARLQQRLRDEQRDMRDYIAEANARGKAPVLQREPRREWAGDMPKSTHVRTSGEPISSYIDAHPSIMRTARRNGISRTRLKDAVSDELKNREIGSRDARYMSDPDKRDVVSSAMSNEMARRRRKEPFAWSNDEVSSCETTDEVISHITTSHDVTVDGSFRDITLENQRACAAGLDRGSEYGEIGHFTLSSRRMSGVDGVMYQNTDTGAMEMVINPAADGYLTCIHESVHGIDATISRGMRSFAVASDAERYNLYSRDVLDSACKKLGVRKNSRTYKDQLFWIFRGDIKIFTENSRNPAEIVAYAIELEESGGGNALSRAIAEEFKNGNVAGSR